MSILALLLSLAGPPTEAEPAPVPDLLEDACAIVPETTCAVLRAVVDALGLSRPLGAGSWCCKGCGAGGEARVTCQGCAPGGRDMPCRSLYRDKPYHLDCPGTTVDDGAGAVSCY
jgi:hypothetical protein